MNRQAEPTLPILVSGDDAFPIRTTEIPLQHSGFPKDLFFFHLWQPSICAPIHPFAA